MTATKKLIVGNWKMHLNTTESETLVRRLHMHTKLSGQAEVVLCPNFVVLEKLQQLLRSLGAEDQFQLGAQNVSNLDEGALTGEISPVMLKGMVEYVIVGHSERRIHFGETDELISQKVAACVRQGLRPILCVGENLQERKEDLAVRTVLDQLEVNLSEVTAAELSKVTIAYEPVWAIGTGEFARPHEVEEMIARIQLFLRERYGAQKADKIRILYGGSVGGDNFQSYVGLSVVSGLLVGGASLNYKIFSKIASV